MDDKQLRDTVKAIIDGIFSEKEEADRQKMTEEAITKSTSTINDLTKALAEQKDAFSALEAQHTDYVDTIATQEASIATFEEAKQKLEEELASAKEELEQLKVTHSEFVASAEASITELTELKTAMAEIESAKVAEARYVELEAEGVSYKDKEKQLAKIKDMTDESFASYKEELLSIKEAIMDSAAKTAASTDADDKTDTKVALANVDKTASKTVSLNTELSTQDDTHTKYQQLGLALAAKLKKDKV